MRVDGCYALLLLLCPPITPPLAQEIATALHRGGGWGYQISLNNNNNNSVAFWFHDCSLMFWNPWARTGGHVKYGVSLAIFLRQLSVYDSRDIFGTTRSSSRNDDLTSVHWYFSEQSSSSFDGGVDGGVLCQPPPEKFFVLGFPVFLSSNEPR